MSNIQKEQEIEAEWKEDWEQIWKPLLYTDGKLDIEKIKNEIHDLWFIYMQVGRVYMELTGGKLSKPSYYADVIISEHEDQLNESYQQGHEDAMDEMKDESDLSLRPEDA